MAILMASVILTATYSLQSVKEIVNEYSGTGKHTPPPGNSVTVTVSKVWIPAKNHPGSVTVQLYRNGIPYGDPVILSDNNNWRYNWTNLDTNSVWTVDESNVPEEYVKTITGNVRDGFVIKNIKNIEPDEPDEPEIPDKPIEAGNPPKTSDDADAKFWLIILTMCVCLLRYVLFTEKERGDETFN